MVKITVKKISKKSDTRKTVVKKATVKKVAAKKIVKKKVVKPKLVAKKPATKSVSKPSVEKEKSFKTTYTAKDISVLQGLEPVRKRPGMYIGTTGVEGVHHLLKEVVSNSIDEAIMGHCDTIRVTLLSNNEVVIEDNGRGFPVDKHPQTKKSALETIMTYLHSGGKFGGKVYASTGGLHGVGLAAVCALSEHVRVEVKRSGDLYSQEYSKGKATTKFKKEGKTKGTGSSVLFRPDPEIFEKIEWRPKSILKYLRQQAYLTKGVKIIFIDKTGEKPISYTFFFENGLVSYVKYLTHGRTPRHDNIFYAKEKKEGVVVEIAMLYTKEFEYAEESFANNVFTPEGGSHLTGFRTALTRSLNDWAKKEKLVKDSDNGLRGSDTREGLTVAISVKVPDPQFEGQTKKKLGNSEVRPIVTEIISEHLSDYLEINRKDARAIIESCLLAQKARRAAKKARQTIFKKGISRFLALPGKLSDCSSRSPEKSEIYLIEGPSAGGTAKQARDRKFQAILPLRGKILNVEKARLDKVLVSEEIKSMIIALGTSIGEEFNIEKLRYHRIILMLDADVDGAHIRTLLLTFFFRYLRPLIESGYVYIAQPPLYSIKVGKQIRYAFTEAEKEKIFKQLKGKNIGLQRYKGLGEMNAEELWETTMDPAVRTLLKVTIDDAEEADRTFDVLMGTEVKPRKKFIQIHAQGVKNLDI